MLRIPDSAVLRRGTALTRALLLAGCAFGAAQAANVTVNTFNMTPTHDASCGLSEAILAVNGGGQMWGCPGGDGFGDAIFLPPGTYTTTAELVVLKSVKIFCQGPGACHITYGNTGEAIIRMTGAGNPSVILSKINLSQPDGNANNATGIIAETGFLNLADMTVAGFEFEGVSIRGGVGGFIQRCAITNNKSAGLSMQSSGNLELSSSSVTGNRYGVLIAGGGGSVTTKANTISGNWMGVYVVRGFLQDGLAGSTISNSTDVGIMIGSSGDAVLENTVIKGNRNRGIFVSDNSTLRLHYCTVDGNSTPGHGGGILVLGTQGAGSNSALVDIIHSTISNNTAGESGGGLFVTGTINMDNGTVSNNTAKRGGGIYHNPPDESGGTAYLRIGSTTVAFNRATVEGGGIYQIGSSSPFSSRGCIVAKNTAPSKPDVSGFIGSQNTLYGDVTGFTGFHDNDYYPLDPLLAPLQDNAGPNRVKTHALLKGSPALDKYSLVSSITADARGLPRNVGLTDLGAYESGPFECELLTVIGKSSDEHWIQTEAAASNGLGAVLSANAVEDFVTYAVAIPEPGEYSITLRVKAGPSRGKYELATAPGTASFTKIGEVDLYRPGLAFVTLPNPATTPALSFTFTSAGIKHFRLRAIGSSGTGHLGYFDRINISRK